MRRSVIMGCGHYLPARILSNAELAAQVDTSDEWIVERTGIRNRHIAAEGETTSQMALKAAQNALAHAGLKADDIDLIVRQFQGMTQAIKFSRKPVVAAPFGMTLGGGCEISLHGAARHPHTRWRSTGEKRAHHRSVVRQDRHADQGKAHGGGGGSNGSRARVG